MVVMMATTVMMLVAMGDSKAGEMEVWGAEQQQLLCQTASRWFVHLYSLPCSLTPEQARNSFGTTSQEHTQWRNVGPGINFGKHTHILHKYVDMYNEVPHLHQYL